MPKLAGRPGVQWKLPRCVTSMGREECMRALQAWMDAGEPDHMMPDDRATHQVNWSIPIELLLALGHYAKRNGRG